METISTYEQQAIDFLASTQTEFEATFSEHAKYFDDDDEEARDIYQIILRRGKREYQFRFGQSIAYSGFYYTKGKNRTEISRQYLKEKNLAAFIKRNDYGFLNNGSSDVIHYPKTPTAYDVLACITKYDPGTFENFCSEFGYDTDSRKAEKTYKAVREEWLNVCKLFSDSEIEQLQEIN